MEGVPISGEKAGAAGANPGSALFQYMPDGPGLVQTGHIRAISTDCASTPNRSRVVLLEPHWSLATRRARRL